MIKGNGTREVVSMIAVVRFFIRNRISDKSLLFLLLGLFC